MSSSRVQELPDDFDEKIDLNATPLPGAGGNDAAAPGPAGPSFEAMMAQAQSAFPPKKKSASQQATADPNAATASLPPAMDAAQQYTADEAWELMNKMPLFMTSLDETGDGEGGENVALEALKALAYEGTRAENAANFREHGNEAAKARNWRDAREFYDKALAALRLPQKPQDPEEGEADMDVVELDEVEEEKKEKAIQEACHANRALCNLELSAPLSRFRHDATELTIPNRKLRIMQQRLRRSSEAQSTQCQGVVPLSVGLPGFGQTRRGRRCLQARSRCRRREPVAPAAVEQD